MSENTEPTLHDEHIQINPIKYVFVLLALIALTLLNTGLAFLPLGVFHGVFAVGIAVLEALMVILFFMHIYWSSRLMKLTVGAGFFTFLVLVVMTLTDYTSRAWGLW
jgi:cytochrome c oxidase subunit 4